MKAGQTMRFASANAVAMVTKVATPWGGDKFFLNTMLMGRSGKPTRKSNFGQWIATEQEAIELAERFIQY